MGSALKARGPGRPKAPQEGQAGGRGSSQVPLRSIRRWRRRQSARGSRCQAGLVGSSCRLSGRRECRCLGACALPRSCGFSIAYLPSPEGRRKTFDTSCYSGDRKWVLAMPTKVEQKLIPVVFFRHEGRWIAHGVDFDIVAHGLTVADAQNQFAWAIVGVVLANVERRRQPFAGVKSAPEFIHKLFDEADTKLASRQIPIPPGVRAPPAFMLSRIVEDGRLLSKIA